MSLNSKQEPLCQLATTELLPQGDKEKGNTKKITKTLLGLMPYSSSHKRTPWGCRGRAKFWTFGQTIQLHSHLTEAVSVLPQFMFVGNKDVSPNIPLGNNKNYPKYSEVTLSGVLAIGVKTSLVLGNYHAISHLIWAKVKVALDFGVFFQVNYLNS